MRHVYEPEKSRVHVATGAVADHSGVGCADVCAERDCICADRIATALRDEPDWRHEPRGAAGVWGWLQRSDDCGADGMGVWRNLYRIRGSTLDAKSGGGKARATKSIC